MVEDEAVSNNHTRQMAGIKAALYISGEPLYERGKKKVTVNRSRSRAVYSLEKLLLHFHSSDQCLSLAGIVVHSTKL